MRSFLLILLITVILSACSQIDKKAQHPEFKTFFNEYKVRGCFLLYDFQEDKTLIYNSERCEQAFVSKVSPARFQGLMQGGWLLATAVGNKLLGVGSYFWDKIEIWQLWAIFVACCLVSAAFIFSIMKRLERLTK